MLKGEGRFLSRHGNKRSPGHAAGTRLIGRHMMEGKLLKFKTVTIDPSQIFDISKVREAGVSAVVCVKSFMPDGTYGGCIIHLVRDTDYGCEVRSRFWMNNDTEETARVRLEHCICDMGILADSLKNVAREWEELDRGAKTSCKFCHSNAVVKNGLRKYTQYWICKNCGRGFVDNQALPRMKYPYDVMKEAVFDYCTGKSLNDICRYIGQEYNLFPSSSTVLGWFIS
jgi:ribosomal protein L37AE/L43A